VDDKAITGCRGDKTAELPSLLRDEHGRGPQTDSFMAAIERNTQRLLHLVGDLLSLAGIQAGQLAYGFRTADLGSIVAGVVDDMRPEAGRKNISLSLSASPLPPFAMDPARVAQLTSNLVTNAVKFTPAGGKVEVRLRKRGGQAQLTVTDTGIGIPATDRERVFERFFRTETASRQAVPGTGLGLTITKAIVTAHHGTIAVDSEEGRGSTFTVCLPLRSVTVPAQGAAPAGEPAAS
jgi:signal transduction histidine kinase